MLALRKSLFRNNAPAGPRGHRAYAIGDIHGRLDLLEDLLAQIEADNHQRGKANTSIVFLGDLIDRGPRSREVIERLRTYRPRGAKAYFLMGNHEEVMLRVLDGETLLMRDWLKFGGAECVRSYGVDPDQLRPERVETLQVLRNAVPREHLEFLRSFADTISFGSYLFVHAGVRPGLPLTEQTQTDLRWIRSPFLTDESDHGFVVVHGHTICSEVEVRSNRIALDTGAYRTGVLTALGIEGTNRWFLQTGDDMVRTASLDAAPAASAGVTSQPVTAGGPGR